jgi:hypothetical protein
MIDLTTIDQGTIIARGQYATIRSAHEDEKKRLSILCGQMAATSSQVLRYMQPDGDATPEIGGVLDMISLARETITKIEACVANIEVLAIQRASLKDSAWGRK